MHALRQGRARPPRVGGRVVDVHAGVDAIGRAAIGCAGCGLAANDIDLAAQIDPGTHAPARLGQWCKLAAAGARDLPLVGADGVDLQEVEANCRHVVPTSEKSQLEPGALRVMSEL